MMERLIDMIMEESDDEFEPLYRAPRPRFIRERADYFDELDNLDFRMRFRQSKHAVLRILERIEDQLEFPSDKNDVVSLVNQLLCALRFYATECSQLSSGDFCGFSQSTAHRIVHTVSLAIAQLRPHYIKFPGSEEDKLRTQLGFFRIARFPRVIGAMNCTHVMIASPGGLEAELYRNRKGYFSINVQAICNANLEFTDIVSRWPGSAHDSTIFNSCNRRALFDAGNYGDSVLVVDSGYPCKPYLMSPLEDPQTRAKNLFNESQIWTRNPV